MRFLSNSLRKVGDLFFRLAESFAGDKRESQNPDSSNPALIETEQRLNSVVDSWFHDKGDETLRLDYDLNENSVVLM
jgi:hypothetical protein